MQTDGIIGRSYSLTNLTKCNMRGLCFIGNFSMKHKPFLVLECEIGTTLQRL